MIFVTGDTHGEFNRLSSRHFRASESDYVIVCGDFGAVWDEGGADQYWLEWLAGKPWTTLFVDGNHENYDLLRALPVEQWMGGAVQRIRPNVLHLMRGQVYEIEGIRFFVMGGASSHDAEVILHPDDPEFQKKRKRLNRLKVRYRVEHQTWWKEELPSEAEFETGLAALAGVQNQVDVILTHCAPTNIQEQIGSSCRPDRLTDYLEQIRNTCSFKLWFFGHYHAERRIDPRFILLYESVVPLSEYLTEQK